jgi:hypothetical protein
MVERNLRAAGKRVHERRWAAAPLDSDPLAGNRILGVWLAPGESVRWEWATLQQGRPYVCGYTIDPPRRPVAREHRPCGFRVDA